MKLAITSDGIDLDAIVSSRFGRAKNFIIVNIDTMDFKCVENIQSINSVSGAGIQAAQIVANEKVDVVITGNCGPKAFKVLESANIKLIVNAGGSIKELIEKYKNGELKITEMPNVKGHWI